jgi:hypothetical protein
LTLRIGPAYRDEWTIDNPFVEILDFRPGYKEEGIDSLTSINVGVLEFGPNT